MSAHGSSQHLVGQTVKIHYGDLVFPEAKIVEITDRFTTAIQNGNRFLLPTDGVAYSTKLTEVKDTSS